MLKSVVRFHLAHKRPDQEVFLEPLSAAIKC